MSELLHYEKDYTFNVNLSLINRANVTKGSPNADSTVESKAINYAAM
jgi:hypothetical protein